MAQRTQRGGEDRAEHASGARSDRRWLLMRGIAWWLGGLWSGWRQAPGRARRAWLAVVLASTGLAAGLSMALAWWVERSVQDGLLAGESMWMERFIAVVPLNVGSAIYLGVPGDTVFLAAVVILASALALRSGRPFLAWSYLITLIVADLAIGAAWLVWDRARPELVIGGAASPGLRAFPSGHVAQALTIYGLSTYLWLRATANTTERVFAVGSLLAVVALIGVTRLELGVHWPSDVVASLLLGVVLAVGLAVAVRAAEQRSRRT